MKKNLIRLFSLMLAVFTTCSVAAGPLSRRADQAKSNQPGISTPVTQAPALDKKSTLTRPHAPVNGAFKSAFSTTAKASDLSLKSKAPRNLASAASAVGLPELQGSVIYSEEMLVGGGGFYTVPTNSSQDFKLLFRYANAEFGGVRVGEHYFTCQDLSNPYFGTYIVYTGYDMTTGKEFFEVNGDYSTYTMTYDRTTSTVYAVANVNGYYTLTKVIFDTEQEKVLFEPIGRIITESYGIWNAIACDSKGQLWGVLSDFKDPAETEGEMVCTGSTLYKIDKNTAEITKVGDTGFDSLYASDAIFDVKTDRLYWTVLNTLKEGFLTEIDTTTGKATLVYAFPGNEQVTGLSIPDPEAEDRAPAAVSDVKVNFSKDELTGTIDFKSPAKYYDGTEGSGNIQYTITANDKPVATGTTTFGAQVSAQVTVPSAGFYTFVVYTSTDAGDSPKVEVKSYVGADTPSATTVTADYNDGVMTISWLPVTSSINGGYIDVNAITYTVKRYPGNKVVADKISDTSCTETLAEPDRLTTYYYDVIANYGNLSSAAARSNEVTLGAVLPPFTATFEDSLDGFKVVDANGDGTTWSPSDGWARILFSNSMDMDDWLISPALKLQGGKIYDLAAQFACGDCDFAERIEVKVGKSSKPDDMTTVLLEPTDIIQERDAPMEWSGVFKPEADGTYYVGFHAISKKKSFILFVDNFSISEAKTPDGPAALTDLTVTPGANGALTATISFTTPSKSLSGAELNEITKIELLRGSKVIHTWTSPAVNTALSFVDNLPAAGEYTYTVVSYSNVGNGPETVETVYVGVDYPASVTGVTALQTATPGEVTLSWDAVTTTQDGKPLDPSLVSYRVYRIMDGTPVPLSGILDATTYTYQAVAEGKQEFVQYAIASITERGNGTILNESLSENIPVGTPYKSFSLSNASDVNKYILGINSRGGGSWGVYDDSFFPSQDNDDRLFAMFAQYADSYGDLYTGLISLEGIQNPGLTFYTFNIPDSEGDAPDNNEISVGVRVSGTLEFVTAKTVVVSETGPVNKWNRVVVDLSEYAGKIIQLNFYSIVKSVAYTIIDNVRLGTIYNNDLAITGISAPAEITTGTDYDIDVLVTNEGMAKAENYTVELYNGNKVVASKAGEPIDAGNSVIIDFTVMMSPVATTGVMYYAKVVWDGDENAANNKSKFVTIKPVASKLPAVGELTGSVDGSEVTLTWTEPDLAAIPADAVTEDFEDGLSFAAHFGEWTFVDRDGSPVDGFQNMTVPNIIDGETKGSFWVWDTDSRGSGSKYFQGHSGKKYLFALYRADGGTADEWAISPELDGSAQTISFYAKSYSADYPEKIKLWYSTGTTDPADFTSIRTISKVSSDWTLYEFDVPAGTKYFAINSCATNAFMLMVDDVTFIPAGATRSTVFEGYDVYRNGVKINDDVIVTREYTDNNVEEGKDYEYVVIAVYNRGQSLPSNAYTINNLGAGIDDVCGDAVSIATDKNSIIVEGAYGLPISVYTVDGKAIYNSLGETRNVIPAQSGVYVVKVGQTAKKVFVK